MPSVKLADRLFLTAESANTPQHVAALGMRVLCADPLAASPAERGRLATAVVEFGRRLSAECQEGWNQQEEA